MSQEYGNDSIRRLKGEERLRTRPESMLGSNGLDGAKHTIIEVVGNATDEKLAGHGDGLKVGMYEDGSVSVRDFGRGVPLGWNPTEEEWNYFLIYEDLYAGGKFEKNQDILKEIDLKQLWDTFKIVNYPYLVTIGLNGVGAAASQYTSEYFEVISYRDGVSSRMTFEHGVHTLDNLEVTDTDEPNGTYIKWKPELGIFTDVNIPSKWLDNLCKSISYVSGFNVEFNNKGNTVVYNSKTIAQELASRVGAENVTEGNNFVHVTDESGDICICDATVVIGSSGSKIEYYHNRVEVSGGVHSSAYNNAIWDFFDEVSKDRNVKIKDADYSGQFSCIISTLSNKMSLRGQTKDSLDDAYVYKCIYSCLKDLLSMEYKKGTGWLLDIIDTAEQNAKNRLAVLEMSKNLKEIEKTTKKHKLSKKFVSCRTYEENKPEQTSFFIVEGDSAGGRVKTARNDLFQCYLAIRGKSLNVYKATLEKLLANAEIRDMISALGCGIDLGIEGYDGFDIKKLKVGKIYFLADADIDGKHILMLLFLIFYKLFPELLYNGLVYIVDTPLYVINCKDDRSVYCMDEKEMMLKRAELGESMVHSVDRFKGLGEAEADVLWDTTLNPEVMVSHQLKIERNDMAMCDVLEVLFGKSTERRKRAILGSMMDDFDGTLDMMQSLSDFVENLELNGDLEIENVVM